jgi:hypothetical protein
MDVEELCKEIGVSVALLYFNFTFDGEIVNLSGIYASF